MLIKVSVITVVYNGEKYLEHTIQSVLNQTYKNIEYIIIDGGSTDGTRDIIKKYEDKLAYWISEKDSGIYDAMNKGIQKATGDYVGLINADDWYELDTIQNIVNSINDEKTIEIVYGNMNIVDIDTNTNKLLLGDINSLNKNMSINHPTCFIKSPLYKERLFDIFYKIAADYDLMLYFRFNNKKFFYIDKVLANMRGGGVSTNNNKTIQEKFMIHKKYYSIKHAYINLWSFKAKVLIRDILNIVLPVKLLNRIKGYK